MSCRIILFLGILYLASALKNSMKIFAEKNLTGESIILTSKYEDLKSWKFFVDNAQSLCTAGRWNSFSEKNFTGEWQGYGLLDLEECFENRTISPSSSLRYLGPEDSNTPAITLYSEENQLGSEYIVEKTADGNIPFPAKSFLTHGWSNWTVFTEPEFKGTSWCINSTRNVHAFWLKNYTLQSVVRSCDKQADYYITLTV